MAGGKVRGSGNRLTRGGGSVGSGASQMQPVRAEARCVVAAAVARRQRIMSVADEYKCTHEKYAVWWVKTACNIYAGHTRHVSGGDSSMVENRHVARRCQACCRYTVVTNARSSACRRRGGTAHGGRERRHTATPEPSPRPKRGNARQRRKRQAAAAGGRQRVYQQRCSTVGE